MEKLTLIRKVLSGQADAAELKELELWIAQSDENKTEFEDIRLLFENESTPEIDGTDDFDTGFERISSTILQRKRARERRRYAVLTAMAIVVVFTGFLFVKELGYEGKVREGMTFDDAPVEEVIRQLEKRYSLRVDVVNRDLLNCRLSATFYKVDSKEEVLRTVEHALGVRFIALAENRYKLEGDGCASLKRA